MTKQWDVSDQLIERTVGPSATEPVVFLGDPVRDATIEMVFEAGAELWSVSRRLKALEALLVERGVLEQGELDGYVFDDEHAAELARDRQELVDRLFDPVLRYAE